jgi:hypothetical protein
VESAEREESVEHGDHDEHDHATTALHVPVKKRGSRKR